MCFFVWKFEYKIKNIQKLLKTFNFYHFEADLYRGSAVWKGKSGSDKWKEENIKSFDFKKEQKNIKFYCAEKKFNMMFCYQDPDPQFSADPDPGSQKVRIQIRWVIKII